MTISQKKDFLKNYNGEDRIVSSLEKNEEIKNLVSNSFRINSHIPTLDKLIEGFEGGEMIVIGGESGHGKTTFAQYLTNTFANQNAKCLWFSFEEPYHLFFRKFNPLPLFYLPNTLKEKKIVWIYDRIIEAKEKFNANIVFIDNLSALVNTTLVESNTSLIDYYLQNFKFITNEHNIILFILAHIKSLNNKIRTGEELDLNDIRGSKMIGGLASTVLFIHRPKGEENENRSWLNVVKARRTGAMYKKIPLLYKGNAIFEEIIDEPPEELTF